MKKEENSAGIYWLLLLLGVGGAAALFLSRKSEATAPPPPTPTGPDELAPPENGLLERFSTVEDVALELDTIDLLYDRGELTAADAVRDLDVAYDAILLLQRLGRATATQTEALTEMIISARSEYRALGG